MRQDSKQVETFEELAHYVMDTLGRRGMLKSELSQEMIFRRGKNCGILFCLHGPRAVKLTAIWETEQNRVLFYGSCGRRMHCTVLARAPSLRE